MTYTNLIGVPVFRAGVIRGERYTEARLRQMARNSNRMRPYFRGALRVKLTHGDAQPTLLEQAALGQSARYYLRRGGDGKLYVMADFADVPAPIAAAARHHYPNVSVEKYRYFEPGDGARVPDVIKSVAFLGADAPEVKGLKMAYPQVFADGRGAVERFGMEESMSLGATIKAWRESLSMTPEDLAGIIGKTPDDIAQYETDAATPDEPTLAAIAEAFGLAVEDLNGGKLPDESAPAQFSETDVQRIVAEAVANAVAPLKAQMAALTAKAQQTAADLFAERKATKTAKIAAKIAKWKERGLPAVLETMGLEAFMARLDDRQVEQFAEGGAQTPLAWFEAMLDKYQEVGAVPLGECADGHPARAEDTVTQIEQYAEQHQIDFATAARALARQGKLRREGE